MSKDAVKVVLLGANSVGKTCFMRRYVEKRFYEEMRPTVGTDFMVQTETTAKGKVNFQIWDTEGYGNDDDYTNNVLNGAKVVVLMYSIVDRPSFDKLSYWTDAVKKMIPKARPLVYVVGTKLDIAEEDSNKRMVTLEMADPVADEFGCIGVVETSAKTGEKIDELFGIIAQDYLARPGKKSGTCAII